MKNIVKFAVLAAVVAMPMFATAEASPIDTTAQIQRAEGCRLVYKGMGYREDEDREAAEAGVDSLNPAEENGDGGEG